MEQPHEKRHALTCYHFEFYNKVHNRNTLNITTYQYNLLTN